MNKKLLSLVAILGGILSLPALALAISDLSFTTDQQTVAPNVISGKLTVSLSAAAGETADLTLTSTSPTGEFSSSNTNWETDNILTVNSNWSNRSFYYRDSTAGTYTIRAVITGRTSGDSQEASQEIVIGEGGVGDQPSDDDDSGDSGNDDSDDNNGGSNSGGSSSSSAHDDPTPLSSAAISAPIKANAGRERLTAVGSAVTFRAVVSGNDDKWSADWTFGDGSAGRGREVKHVYPLPGTYQVVLNIYQNNEVIAVSRTKVKVIKPDLAWSFDPQLSALVIKNESNDEINLGGWAIRDDNDNKKAVLPKDTLLAGQNTLYFSLPWLGLNPAGANWTLVNGLGQAMMSTARSNSATTSVLSQEQMGKLLIVLAQQAARERQKVQPVMVAAPVNSPSQVLGTSTLITSPTSRPTTTEVIELTKKPNWLGQLWSRLTGRH